MVAGSGAEQFSVLVSNIWTEIKIESGRSRVAQFQFELRLYKFNEFLSHWRFVRHFVPAFSMPFPERL